MRLENRLSLVNVASLPEPRRRWRRQVGAVALAISLQILQLSRARAQNHADYRFESYREDDHRIKVETESGLFDVKPLPWLEIKGEVVYDSISGATPTGAPPLSQIKVINIFTGQPIKGLSRKVPVVDLEDERWAFGIEPTISYGPHHFTPGFAYSDESDYTSYGTSFNYSLDLFEKNTTLNLGWAHNADQVLHGTGNWEGKDTDDYLIGVNQLLSPKTVLAANFTYGLARGYLSDPYKGVFFEGFTIFKDPTDPSPLIPPTAEENRPSRREKYIAYTSLTQFITPLDASIEASYRFYHDTYGVDSHTVGLNWFQKIGKKIVISPSIRYSYQTAADFYVVSLPGTPGDPGTPRYYSADYRLSELQSFTYGITATARLTDWLSVDIGYKRYEMFGLDDVTSSSAYPKANILTLGARIWF